MMFTAEWDGKFVADLPSKSSRPGKFDMMGITRGALVDRAVPRALKTLIATPLQSEV
jgi:hypothetical protein